MSALVFIVNAILQYLLVPAFLLRLLLPLVRANMRNPLSQAVLRITNPLVLPLRRILRPIGRIDSASLLAVILVQLVTTLIIMGMSGYIGGPAFIAKQASYDLIDLILQLYSFAVFIYVLLSWIAPATYSPAGDLLSSICEPILRPVRRLIPAIAGLDLTPVFVLIGLQALRIALRSLYFH